jgi:hypothetical protein
MSTRIVALVLMGAISIFTIATPFGMLAGGGKEALIGTGLIVAFILTALIAFTGHLSSVWSRLCLVNGLAALALPLVAIAISAMMAPEVVKRASFSAGGTHAADAGAQVGVALGGAMITGVAAFVGFTVGAIFLILAFFLRKRHA